MRLPNFLKTSKKISWKKLALLAVPLVLLVFFLFPKGNKIAPEYTEVKRGDIKQLISASGVLNGKNSANLKFKTSGKLAYINVKSGDSVIQGQVIAGLDTQALSIDLQQAQNSYRSAQAAAEKAEDDVKNHIGDETFTQKQTRTTAQAARDSAYDEVKAAQRAFQDAVIVSPIDGIITQANPLPGQVVSVSDIVAQVVDWSEVYFDADVDEADISKISLDQPVDITLNSYPDKVFQGNVKEISPATKTASSGSTVVTVRIDLHNPGVHLVTGLNGQAEIIASEVKNVLVIPQDALKDENHVIVKSNNDPQLVEVKTGLLSDTDVEIISGLKEGQKVVKNPSVIKLPAKTPNPLTRFTRSLLPRNVTR